MELDQLTLWRTDNEAKILRIKERIKNKKFKHLLSDESDPASEDEKFGGKDLTFYNLAKADRHRRKVIVTEWVQKFKKTNGKDP
jgi:hypothetical protein